MVEILGSLFVVVGIFVGLAFIYSGRAFARKEDALGRLLQVLGDIEVLDGSMKVYLPCACGSMLLGDGVKARDSLRLHGRTLCQPMQEVIA